MIDIKKRRDRNRHAHLSVSEPRPHFIKCGLRGVGAEVNGVRCPLLSCIGARGGVEKCG